MFGRRNQSRNRQVAVLGAFRSGTNFLRTLLESNFACETVYHAYGWKHGFVPVLSGQSAFSIPPMPGAFVTKAPLSFLASLHRYYVEVDRNIDAPKEWEAFLRSPLTIFVQTRGEGPEYRFSNPVEYWNALNWNYASVARAGGTLVHARYEDLLSEPEAEVARLAETLDLRRTSSTFYVPERKVRRMSDAKGKRGDFESDSAFDKGFYTKAEFLTGYSDADRAFVQERLDQELLSELRYAPDGIGLLT